MLAEAATVIVFVPAAVALFSWVIAPEIVSPPVKVFAAFRISVPDAPDAAPVTLMPSVPSKGAVIVAVRFNTWIVAGAVAASRSMVKVAPPLAARIQSLLAVVASWKINLPTVRDVVSIVTVRFAVMLIVLKSATAPVAFGTVFGVQRVATDQLSEASAFHTSALVLLVETTAARAVAILWERMR